MKTSTTVTTAQTFYTYEDVPVFCVNAGVPVEDAMEIATNLMHYVHSLAAADAFVDKALESAMIQHFSEMAKALNLACKHSVKAASETNA